MEGKPWGRKSLDFKVHSLIDRVYKPLNLYIAWEKVRVNRGCGGVDRVSLEATIACITTLLKRMMRFVIGISLNLNGVSENLG